MNPKIAPIPIACAVNVASAFSTGTSNRPRIPATPCTLIAPTGSSIPFFSKKLIERGTNKPPNAPYRIANSGDGVNGSAVITTRPANAPFVAAFNAVLPNHSLLSTIAVNKPAAAAVLVFTKIFATASAFAMPSIANCEPPLNPNQPIQRMRVPSATCEAFEP